MTFYILISHYRDFNVQRILIDNESSTDILFISAFNKNEDLAWQASPISHSINRIWGRINSTPWVD